MSKEEYIERTIKIMQQLDVEILKKVYTFAKTLNDISQEEKKEARHNGEEKRECELRNGDYQHGKTAAYHLPDCAGGIADQ